MFISVLITMIDWIPAMEIFVFIATSLLFISALYFAYRVVVTLYQHQLNKKIFPLFISTLLLALYIAFFVIIDLSAYIFSPVYVEKHQFNQHTFYLYDSGFLDRDIEVHKQHHFLPILSATIATVPNPNAPVELEQRGAFIYVVSDRVDTRCSSF